jgi:hypothetical protein
MNWVKAEGFKPEYGKWYVVWTNGQEWHDHHIHLYPGTMLAHYLKPDMVRGRPLWVAEVTDPTPRLVCDVRSNYNGRVSCLSCGNSWDGSIGVTGCSEGKPKTT